MIHFISHRGNLNGPNPAFENRPEYVELAIHDSHAVEVDLRRIGGEFYLGHDYPQYRVSKEWLDRYCQKLLIHVKDIHALKEVNPKWHYFCHTSDAFTVTSHELIWLHELSLPTNARTVVPLMT